MFRLLIAILFLLFVYHVREVFPPFIMGAITAYILYPFVKYLNQRVGLAPIFSVFVIYVVAASITVLVAFHWWPILVDQAQSLFSQRTEIVKNLVQQVTQQFGWSLDVDQVTYLLIGQLQSAVGKPEEIMHFGGLISKSLLGMLVCAVTSVYMLVDNRRVGRFFMRFVPVEKRNTVVSLLAQMDLMFRKYVVGQVGLITLMSVVAFFIYTGFHLRYALLIALITGFLEIVPVLGPMLAIVICTVFAVAQLGLANAMGVPLCLWVARLVEDYIVVPNTIGHAVELHPLAVIFAVVVGETMAGALGMLIAIPVAASVKVIIDFCYPATTPPPHHGPKENTLAWLIKAFSPPKRPEDETMADKAKQDMLSINNMHETSNERHQAGDSRLQRESMKAGPEEKPARSGAVVSTAAKEPVPAIPDSPKSAQADSQTSTGSPQATSATSASKSDEAATASPTTVEKTGSPTSAKKPAEATSSSQPAKSTASDQQARTDEKKLEQTTPEQPAKPEPKTPDTKQSSAKVQSAPNKSAPGDTQPQSAKAAQEEAQPKESEKKQPASEPSPKDGRTTRGENK